MSDAFATLDAAGWLLAVYGTSADAPPEAFRLLDWEQPTPPAAGLRLRLAAHPGAAAGFEAGELYWADPRSLDQLATEARATRDTLLAGCDWRVTRGVELGTGVPAPWAAYRQALRDVTAQPSFPAAISWPEPPAV